MFVLYVVLLALDGFGNTAAMSSSTVHGFRSYDACATAASHIRGAMTQSEKPRRPLVVATCVEVK